MQKYLLLVEFYGNLLVITKFRGRPCEERGRLKIITSRISSLNDHNSCHYSIIIKLENYKDILTKY